MRVRWTAGIVLAAVGAPFIAQGAWAAPSPPAEACTAIPTSGMTVTPDTHEVAIRQGWTCGESTFEAVDTFTGSDCSDPQTVDATLPNTGKITSRTTVSCRVTDEGTVRAVAELTVRDASGKVTSRALASTSRSAPAGKAVEFTANTELFDEKVFWGIRTRLLKNCTGMDIAGSEIHTGMSCSTVGETLSS